MELLPFHEKIYNKLDEFITKNTIPHIIFHGKTGSGKRTIVNEFINKIYKEDKQKIKTNVLTVNCAQGKGIKFIREELKFFAKTNIQTNNGRFFKTILLLNAGNLTMDAQSALRRCIELFSYNTRFFIVIEDKNKLLNPILSRFCEIHVPEYVNRENQVVNLHRHFINEEHKIEPPIEFNKIIKDGLMMEKTHHNLIGLVEYFYNIGISCLELIEYIKTDPSVEEELRVKTSICFDTIRSEFRNEKLLMFYILDYLYIRSNKDLKSILVL